MPFVNDQLLHAADRIMSIQGPTAFNVASSILTIIQRLWFGGQPGAEGGFQDGGNGPNNTPLSLNQYYEVAPVSTSQIMGSGGQYEMGDVRMGAITPAFNDRRSIPPVIGGYSEAQLHPVPTTDNIEIIYSITGKHAGEYQFVALESWDPLGYYLVMRRRITKPTEP